MKKKEIEHIALSVCKNETSPRDTQRDITCWKMYHSNVDNKELSYLNKFGDYQLPAKVPFNTITRDNIDWIVSRYVSRPFVFSTKAIDDYSVKQKYRKKLEQYFKVVDDRIQGRLSQIKLQREKINLERQTIQKVLQQQPENEEQQAKLQNLQAKMPEINAQFEKVLYLLEREAKFTDEDKQQVDEYFKYTYKDIEEILSKKALLSLKDKLDIDTKNEKSFLEYNVTGNPYFYVDYDEKNKKYIYDHVPGYSVSIFGRDDSEYTNQATVAVITQKRSLSNVLRDYGEQLNEQQIRSLHAGYDIGQQTWIPYHDDVDESYRFRDNLQYDRNTVLVKRVFILANERLDFIESPAKHNPELRHYHQMKDGDNVRKYQSKKTKYANYTYEAVVINDKYVVDAKPRIEQDKATRKISDPGYAELPVIGFNFNDIDRSKYSLIWATKDLQSLRNMIDYYEEYLLATSGVKTLLMDKSQIPEGMQPDEWMYEKKLGVAWVETVKKSLGIQGRKSNFNNWTVFDETISPAIQYLEGMKQSIDASVDRLSGVSRQARGDMSQYDGAKTSELAVESSSIITDIIYWRHDKLVREALTRLLRLWSNIENKQNNFIQFLDEEGFLDTEFIPKDTLRLKDIDTIITDNNEEMRKMKNIENIASAAAQKGTLDLSQLTKVMSSKTVNQMEKKLDTFLERSLEYQRMQQQDAMQAEQQKEQIKADLDKYIADQKNQVEQYKLQLDEARLGLEKEIEGAKLQVRREENKSGTFAKVFDTITERETEMAYLDEQRRASMVDEILQSTNSIIDAVLTENSGKREERMNEKKVEVEKEKAKTHRQRPNSNSDNRTSTKPRSKEKIKD